MLAFVGIGNIAIEHLKVLNSLNQKVSFVCSKSNKSKNWKKFKKISPDTKYIKNPKDLIENKKIKIIFFFLPWHTNYKFIEFCESKDKKFFFEKPLALHRKQLLFFNLNKQKNVFVGFNRRFYKTVNTLKQRIKINDITSVEIKISEDINNLIARHGPSILDYVLEYSSCHILDLMFFLFGKIKINKIFKTKLLIKNKYKFYNYIVNANSNHIPIHLSIVANDPIGVGIFVKFKDYTSWELSPIERLRVYKGYDKKEPSNKRRIRIYKRKKIFDLFEKSKFKPGFRNQAVALLRNNEDIFHKPKDSKMMLNFTSELKEKKWN